jgi:hypothetical protein
MTERQFRERLREFLDGLKADYRELRALTEKSGGEAAADLRQKYANVIRELTLFGREEFGIEEAND